MENGCGMAKRNSPLTKPPSKAVSLRRPLALPLVLAFFYLYIANQYPDWKDTNPCSRVYQTFALVDEGEFAIDNCLARYGNTQDKAQFEGHFYSDKPPGVAFWLSPWARLLRLVIPIDDFDSMYYGLRVLGLSLPAALFWYATWPRWTAWSGSATGGTWMVLLGGLGTGWFAYSCALYSHVPAGMLLFLAFLALRQCHAENDVKRQRLLAFLAGLLAGAALICDFVVAFAVPVLGAWALLGGMRRPNFGATLPWLLGLVPPLAAWMLYNTACFGGPLQVGFLSHSDQNFAGVYRGGWFGMQPPDPAAVTGLLFSPARGLFFVSPALLVGPWGLWRAARGRATLPSNASAGVSPGEAAVCLSIAVAILAFATTTVDWRAGWAYGPRYLMPAVPFLLVGVAAAMGHCATGTRVPAFVAAGSVMGLGWSTLAMLTTPLMVQEFRHPLLWFAGKTLSEGHVARTLASPWLDVWSALPVVLAAGAVAAWLMAAPLSAGSAARPVAQVLRRTLLTLTLLLAGQLSIPDWPEARLAQQIQRAELLIRLGYLDAAQAALEQLDPTQNRVNAPRTSPPDTTGGGR